MAQIVFQVRLLVILGSYHLGNRIREAIYKDYSALIFVTSMCLEYVRLGHLRPL